MSKNRQKQIKRSMMRYDVSDDKAGHVRSTGWSTVQFMCREEGCMYCMYVYVGVGEVR